VAFCKVQAIPMEIIVRTGGSLNIPAAIKAIEPKPGVNLPKITINDPYFSNHLLRRYILLILKYLFIKLLFKTLSPCAYPR
jgi:hypothetical protein